MGKAAPNPRVHPWWIGGGGGGDERIGKWEGGDIMGMIKSFHGKIKVNNVLGKLRLLFKWKCSKCWCGVGLKFSGDYISTSIQLRTNGFKLGLFLFSNVFFDASVII